MSKELTFNEVRVSHFKTLDQYVPIVDRVHGNNHPEFHDVKKIYELISEKSKLAGTSNPDLKEEFKNLRSITNNYEVPSGVCETYKAVYKMLEEADKKYHS